MADENIDVSKVQKPVAKKAAKKPVKTKPKKVSNPDSANGGKGKTWTFPQHSLEEAIRIPRALDEKFAGNPTPASDLLKAVGYNQFDWRFGNLLKAANLYGLVTGTGASATVAIATLGQDIVAPKTPPQRSKALIDAFRTVEDFKKVEDYYGGKRIPEDEFFTNTLTREFNIPKDRVDVFSTIFQTNLKFLRSFQPIQIHSSDIIKTKSKEILDPDHTVISIENVRTGTSFEERRIREFLDTCFVMMPFGEWPDRYYKEIFVPAIKEAGLEPVRGDELYHTGSVVEQIWDQIEKAKLLVADLTGRNPNVFYELGLAHAAIKPVVFTAANIEDVPFDLRHLRVILYDVREPNWAATLRKNISEYLRNAIREPNKSIPQPFRKVAENISQKES